MKFEKDTIPLPSTTSPDGNSITVTPSPYVKKGDIIIGTESLAEFIRNNPDTVKDLTNSR